MELAEFKRLVGEVSFGKKLPNALYVHLDGEAELPEALIGLLKGCRSDLAAEGHSVDGLNVLKFHRDALKVSFLGYPEFDEEPHPQLGRSVVVDLAQGRIRATDYTARGNRPILHRKETFLPPGDARMPLFEKLTSQEEGFGLFENSATIGFQENWAKLLAEKGLSYDGHELVESIERVEPGVGESGGEIDRWRTAMTRTDLSKPIKMLLQSGVLTKSATLFDYGCGLGSDVAGLREIGYRVAGWDPAFAPEEALVESDIVNLGYVLNVIEDPAERIDALTRAWELARKALVISVLMDGKQTYSSAEQHGDGIRTRNNTFQKYFLAGEFQVLVEHALDTEATPAGLGVFIVFRKLEDQQAYLAKRSRRAVNWEAISQRLRSLRPPKPSRATLYSRHRELLDAFWGRCLELGRAPADAEEHSEYQTVREAAGSIPKAQQVFLDNDENREDLEEAAKRRREDTLVFLASGEFQKRRTPLTRLPPSVRRDIKTFFGDYSSACDESRDLLFASGDPDELELALDGIEFGWIDADEGHYAFHRSLLGELPPIPGEERDEVETCFLGKLVFLKPTTEVEVSILVSVVLDRTPSRLCCFQNDSRKTEKIRQVCGE